MAYKEFRLENGRIVVSDFLKEEDLPEVVDALNSVIREGIYLANETEIVDMELERKWFHDHMNSGMSYLVARVDGEVVGGASIEPRTGKSAHIAVFGIFIKDGFRNMGVGTHLTNASIEIACQRGFEILQLSTLGSNKRAHHVYKKCGFAEIGKIKRGVKLPNNTYTNYIIMTLDLKQTRQGT
jgi:RimJ/RimL family protein N-acetyltransferase